MKKLLFSLAAIVCMSSAWAQEATTIDSFMNFSAMDDETEFTYSSEAIALYQNGKYLFARSIVTVTDEDGETKYYSYPALIYGNAGQTYTNGDVIPAGWSATKTTYKGMPEAKNPSGLQTATEQIENADVWAAPLDYSGYIQYMTDEQYYDAFAGEYMTFGPVTISDVNGNGFTISEEAFDWDTYEYVSYSMPGYNMFYKTVSLPTNLDKQYTITGFYYIYNDAMQFVPVAIEEYYEPSDLYGVWYYGVDDDVYRITDELYVVEPTKATEVEEGSKNYIYVTDNLWEYDYYGWIFDWIPTYMAIDCEDNTELYNKIASMQTIEAGTLIATLKSNFTNPRLVPLFEPSASENTTELRYSEVNLNDTLLTNGHNIISLTAVYKVIDGKEYLMGWDENWNLWQPIPLDRRYLGNDIQFNDGEQYHFNRVVVKQQEAWNSNDPIREAKAINSPKEFKVKALNEKPANLGARKAPRHMNPNDPRYYENYVICPLDGEVIPTAVNDVNTVKQVSSVQYVNVAGQMSNTPFEGVNIVVTNYTDGTKTTTKVVK